LEAEDSKLKKEAVAEAERRESRVSCLSCIFIFYLMGVDLNELAVSGLR
jgi:hypothetical protein